MNTSSSSKEIVAIDLRDYQPEVKSVLFDFTPGLFQGLMLREKEFRAFLAEMDFEAFRNKPVAIGCSSEAIIPSWAYLSVAEKFVGVASRIAYSTQEQLDIQLWVEEIEKADFSGFKDKKVVVRQVSGIAPELYVAITLQLKPLVKTLMYGEIGLPKVIFKND